MDKQSMLASLGWRLIRVIPDKLISDYTLELIKKAIEN